jgi:outer membrane protein
MRRILTLFFVLSLFRTLSGQPLSLSDCIRLAEQANPDLQKSRISLKQSGISLAQAWTGILPSASANASTSNTGPFASAVSDDWSWSVGGSVSQPFYQPGLYTGIGQARALRNASIHSADAIHAQIAASVEKGFLQILASDTLVGVYRASLALADEQIVKMEQLVSLGLKRQSDLLKQRVQRGTFESQLVRQMESLASSRRSLNVLMGRDPGSVLEILPLAVDSIAVPELDEALALMRRRNPSLLQLESQVSAQKWSLAISREAFLPSLSGTYSYSRRGSAFSGPALESDQVSLMLSLSLFDGFNRIQNMQKSGLNLKEAKLTLDASIRDYKEALLNQYESLATQNRLIAVDRTSLASAQKDFELVSQQYAAGFSTVLDLNDSQVSLLESETNLLSDLYSRKQIEAEIRRLIGN